MIEGSRFQVRGGKERRSSAGSGQPRRRNAASPDGTKKDGSVNDRASQDSAAAGFARDTARDRRSAERRAEERRSLASRRKIRPTGISQAESSSHQLSVTVSIGVSEPSAKAGAPEQVIQSADKALYRAKQSGRNRVESGIAPRLVKPRRNIA